MSSETPGNRPGIGNGSAPQRGGRWAIAAALGLVVSVWAVFFYAPTELTMGDLQRIFYFHIASWWLAFAAFLLVAGASIAWLRTRNPRYDMAALAAAEIGTLFATTGLAMGIIWAKPAWGIWWTWDARLTTAFVLWLIYAGYLLLRGYVDDPTRRANLAAVLGILGGADVPIVYFSIRWWRTQHPAPVIMGGPDSGLHPDMWVALLICLAAFTFLFLWLFTWRMELEREARAVEAMRQRQLAEAP
ncbi:MAG: cytochrome C assembly protein [Acidobacteria bacterium]|nr:cytochrome C assembly protein [Acidobacteriota bacterium]MYH23263.1 cytochrome C assembly protein [Acidobacteriota bacterium]MYK78766.1 cytochrome C assembly protein [Acidobacteriota bacterium]